LTTKVKMRGTGPKHHHLANHARRTQHFLLLRLSTAEPQNPVVLCASETQFFCWYIFTVLLMDCGLSGCTILSHFFYKHHDFRENFEYDISLFILSTTLSETFLILRRIQRDIVINVHTYSCKIPVVLAKFWRDLNFFRKVFDKSWNTKYLCGHADRWTDRQIDRHTWRS
jgi:hypothetical protein